MTRLGNMTGLTGKRILREVAPRVIADLILVHLSALAALAGVLVWQKTDAGGPPAAVVIVLLRDLYTSTFVPLSFVFPFVYFANGFYTRSRSFAVTYKWIFLARGATLASMTFILA